jgi:hypothetical protein
MELVVDFSGSMMDDNKFTALQSALNTLFDDLGAQADPSIGVGMIAFSDQKDPTTGMGPYPTDADVPLRLVDGTQKTALKTRIATTPMNATPTYPALQGAYPILEALDPASAALPAGGKKVVVLMTDGIPTEPPGDTRPNIIALASAKLSLVAPQGPIYLFSVGIGQFPGNSGTYDPQFLGQLAVAGGTRSSATCNPLETANVGNVCYFQVTPDASAGPTVLEQKFIDAINAIRSQAALCDFDIQVPEGGTVAANQVNVVFIAGSGAQHVVYPNGAKNTDGWTLDNATSPTKVLLHGKSCSDVKTDLKSKISVVLGCTTVAAP